MSQSRSRASQFSRRNFLRGAGGVCLTLPWLERLHGVAHAQSGPGAGPKRVIVMTYPMGVPGGAWRPRGSGSGFTLPYVTEPLARFQDRCLFVSSMDNPVLDEGGSSFTYGHPAKAEAALTGTLTTGAFPTANQNHIDELRSGAANTGGANGPSVEHLIGQHLRAQQPQASVDLGVGGGGLNSAGAQTSSSAFSYEGAGNPVSLQLSPQAAFSSLFSGLSTGSEAPSAEQAAMRQLRLRNKSVLDAVRDSFKELKQGLGSQDRKRLEEHAGLIRQLELDVQQAAGQCSAPEGIDGAGGLSMAEQAALQTRVLAHAMGCDLAPVGRIEFQGQQNPRFGIAELDSVLDTYQGSYDWHAMVHGDALPGTSSFLRPGRDDSRQDYDSRLLAGYRFFVQQFADLLGALDAIPEGPDTSVLDNSMVILASDLGEGIGHAHMKMGYIVAGNLGEAQRGYHLDAGPASGFAAGGSYFWDRSRYNVNQLLHSMLDMAGVQDTQGGPATMGLGGYLEREGLPRRIDELFG